MNEAVGEEVEKERSGKCDCAVLSSGMVEIWWWGGGSKTSGDCVGGCGR